MVGGNGEGEWWGDRQVSSVALACTIRHPGTRAVHPARAPPLGPRTSGFIFCATSISATRW